MIDHFLQEKIETEDPICLTYQEDKYIVGASLINTERSYLGRGLTTGAQDIHQTHAHHDLLGRNFHFRPNVGRAGPPFYCRVFALYNGGRRFAGGALSTTWPLADRAEASAAADYLPQPHRCVQL